MGKITAQVEFERWPASDPRTVASVQLESGDYVVPALIAGKPAKGNFAAHVKQSINPNCAWVEDESSIIYLVVTKRLAPGAILTLPLAQEDGAVWVPDDVEDSGDSD
jgi:hypothetical protein